MAVKEIVISVYVDLQHSIREQRIILTNNVNNGTLLQMSTLPIQQCFGLIFTERFLSLGIAATQTSLILHLNGTVTCSLGLISGPMMRRFTFRKVAIIGSLTIAAGIYMTAFAVSVPSIIMTYCFVVGKQFVSTYDFIESCDFLKYFSTRTTNHLN